MFSARTRQRPSSLLPLFRTYAILVVPILLFGSVLAAAWTSHLSQQFADLAQAFLHGHLNFSLPIGWVGQDPVIYHGKIYWDEGPFPTVLLMPFVVLFRAFGHFFFQEYLQLPLTLSVFYLVFGLARRLAYSIRDSLILAFGFVLGSVFIGVAAAPSAWYFAQVVTTFLLFWSLYEFFGRRRWWLIGLICGLTLLTRITAWPIALFFGLELLGGLRSVSRRRALAYVSQLCLPTVAAALLIGLYNFARFHDPFNGGYDWQLVSTSSGQARALGVFSLIHVPTNLVGLVLSAPIPALRDATSWTLKFPFIRNNPYGMSIFLTSPYLLYLFSRKPDWLTGQARRLLVAIGVSMVGVLCFYGIGRDQFGYRYSLDFLPELFVLFMLAYRAHHRQLSRGMKTLLLGAGLFNFYLLWTFL